MVLIIWLLPLIGVAVTSVRPSSDLAAGNYFGMPSGFAGIENYTAVFRDSPIGWYILNSFKVTIPTVIGAVALSCLSGFALAIYRFKSNLFVFFMFVAGNFIPFQILMVPVRDLTLKVGLYDTTMGLVLFHVAFQTGLLHALHAQLHQGAALCTDRIGAGGRRVGMEDLSPHRAALMRPAIAALSVLIFFTFVWNDYFWATVLVQGQHAMPVTAGLYSLNGQWVAAWHLVSAGSIIAALPPVAMFLPDAEALHRRPDAGSDKGMSARVDIGNDLIGLSLNLPDVGMPEFLDFGPYAPSGGGRGIRAAVEPHQRHGCRAALLRAAPDGGMGFFAGRPLRAPRRDRLHPLDRGLERPTVKDRRPGFAGPIPSPALLWRSIVTAHPQGVIAMQVRLTNAGAGCSRSTAAWRPACRFRKGRRC